MLFLYNIIFLALSSGGWATTFFKKPFTEFVSQAPIVVRGIAGPSRSEWYEPKSGQKQIVTYSDLDVSEVLRGGLSEGTIRVRTPGGQVGDLNMDVSGTPKFEPGEDVVLMLRGPESDGSYQPTGLMMGKLNVINQQWLSGPAMDKPSKESKAGDRWSVERFRILVSSQRAPVQKEIAKPPPIVPMKGGPPPVSDRNLTPPVSPEAPEVPEIDDASKSPSYSLFFLISGIIFVVGGWMWLRSRKS